MRTFVSFTLLILSCTITAQDNNLVERYNDFKKQANKDYIDFRDKANKEYIQFIKEAWKSYQGKPAIPKPKEEPPIPPQPYDEKEDTVENKEITIEEIVPPPPPPAPAPLPIAPIKEQPRPVVRPFTFSFYGTDANVQLSEEHLFRLTDCSETSIAKAWEFCSDGRFDNLIRDCLALRIKHNLCDWGYLKMLQSMSQAFFGNNTNESTLLTAFVYCQSGYKIRLAKGNKLYLLVASPHIIYDRPYFEINNDIYYPINCDESSVHISNASFPNEKPLSLWINKNVSLAFSNGGTRTLQSSRFPELEISFSSNNNLIEFYNNYPTSEIDNNFMTRWAIYATTPLNNDMSNCIYPQIKKSIEGLSEQQAAERLLNFVQTAFKYEYDDKVWGCDRAFFAEESLYYPYCDCEDRSILFSRLVRDLLGLDVILVYYPGHLATAVHFNSNVEGDYIMHKNKKYIVCDPTYIGAPVGNTMPGMNNNEAKVILL